MGAAKRRQRRVSNSANTLAVSAQREINALHRELLSLGKTALEKAVRIGELLTQAKDSVKHGQWLPWVKANIDFSDQTARNYMRVYGLRDHPKFKSVLNLNDAYALTNGKTEEVSALLTEALQLFTEADALQDEEVENPDLSAKPNPRVDAIAERGR